jgi:hypothetical protein
MLSMSSSRRCLQRKGMPLAATRRLREHHTSSGGEVTRGFKPMKAMPMKNRPERI